MEKRYVFYYAEQREGAQFGVFGEGMAVREGDSVKEKPDGTFIFRLQQFKTRVVPMNKEKGILQDTVVQDPTGRFVERRVRPAYLFVDIEEMPSSSPA